MKAAEGGGQNCGCRRRGVGRRLQLACQTPAGGKPAPLVTPMAAEEVRGDAEQPRPGVGLAEVVASGVEGPCERLRGNLLAQIPAHPSRRITVDRLEMAIEEDGEGAWLDR